MTGASSLVASDRSSLYTIAERCRDERLFEYLLIRTGIDNFLARSELSRREARKTNTEERVENAQAHSTVDDSRETTHHDERL